MLGDADTVLIQSTKPIDPRREALLDQIAKLEEVDRTLALMLLDGSSYREMSSVLGISESNVGVRIHRIKKRLVENLTTGSDR